MRLSGGAPLPCASPHNSTTTIDLNLIDVELYGIVYIYNPVNKSQLGQDAAARHNLERALAIKEKSFGTASPQLVETLANLADLHFRHGRYAEAEPLYRRLLALRKQGVEYKDWDKVLADYSRLTARSR